MSSFAFQRSVGSDDGISPKPPSGNFYQENLEILSEIPKAGKGMRIDEYDAVHNQVEKKELHD